MSNKHKHHGLWHKVTSPFARLYHQTVTPFYEWLGSTLFTRATAGRIGRKARIARFIGNMISLTAVIVVISMVGLSTFWSGGAALPLWALFVVGVGVSINTIGLVINSAASHIKIGQYYDAEHEQHAENNDLRGHEEPLKNKRYLLKATRTLHDINGLGGTLISWTLALSEALLWASVGSFIIAPQIAAVLFVTSRISALVSALGVWGTNQYRLHEYKKTLSKQQNDAFELKKMSNQDRHTMISKTVDSVFHDLNADKKETVSSWVWFRCYQALDQAMKPQDKVVTEHTMRALKAALENFRSADGKFSRDALMSIQCQSPQDTSGRVSVLDSMPLLEARLFDKLAPAIDPRQYDYAKSQLATEGTTQVQGSSSNEQAIFEYHVTTKLYHGSRFNDIQRCTINKEEILAKYPVAGTAHGTSYLPYYHGKKAAQDMMKRSAPSSRNNQGLRPVALLWQN